MTNSLEIVLCALLALVQIGILIWYFVSNRRKRRKRDAAKAALAREYPYEGLRNLAFTSIPGYIIASAPADEFFIYSIIVDWNIGDDMVTIAAQVTGEVSMYVKSGGGIVGAGKHLNVSEATQMLFFLAGTVIEEFETYAETGLPEKNHVAIYLLTNRGNFRATDTVHGMESKHSKFHALFKQVNVVIAEMKKSAKLQ